jgi:hypothetical protein
MNLDYKAFIPAHVMARDVGGEVVVLDLEGGTYYGLDAVGAHIWQHLSQSKTLAETLAAILDLYDISSEQAQRDLIALVRDLQSHKLIELRSDAIEST